MGTRIVYAMSEEVLLLSLLVSYLAVLTCCISQLCCLFFHDHITSMTHSHLVITNTLSALYICHVLFVHSLSLFPGGEAYPEMRQALVVLFFFVSPFVLWCHCMFL